MRHSARGYPHNLIEKIISEVKFTERKSSLQQKEEVRNRILPFVTMALLNLKKHLDEQMAFNSKPTIALRNIQRVPTYLIQKRKIYS